MNLPVVRELASWYSRGKEEYVLGVCGSENQSSIFLVFLDNIKVNIFKVVTDGRLPGTCMEGKTRPSAITTLDREAPVDPKRKAVKTITTPIGHFSVCFFPFFFRYCPMEGHGGVALMQKSR